MRIEFYCETTRKLFSIAMCHTPFSYMTRHTPVLLIYMYDTGPLQRTQRSVQSPPRCYDSTDNLTPRSRAAQLTVITRSRAQSLPPRCRPPTPRSFHRALNTLGPGTCAPGSSATYVIRTAISAMITQGTKGITRNGSRHDGKPAPSHNAARRRPDMTSHARHCGASWEL